MTTAYEIVKERARVHSLAKSAAGRDIGKIPPVKNPERRAEATRSYRIFCEEYFPQTFTLAWSADHLKVIKKLEETITQAMMYAMGLPRGSGKTTLCEKAVEWGILTGVHQFIYLIGATSDAALACLDNIKTDFSTNELLLEDFPDSIYPIRC